MDLLAELLRRTSHFRGKRWLLQLWTRRHPGMRTRILPGGLSMTLRMDSPYEATIWLGLEERRELKALPGLLRRGDVFIDCGANLGLWALVAAPIVGAQGAVIAFEPNPHSAKRLREHASQAEGIIDVRELALGKLAGEGKLMLGSEHSVAHLSDSGTVPVRVTTLDVELEGPPAGIKIDVEGSELEVLTGAERMLYHRPWIAVEFNSTYAGDCSLGDWPVGRLLNRLGYNALSFSGRQLPDSWRPKRDYENILFTA